MKIKTLISLLVFMALSFFSRAQNLVPNYSFEQIKKCTTGLGEFNGYVANWIGQSGANSGLSYYTHQCPGDSAGGGSVPYNTFDGSYYSFQYAHSGVSYGAVVSFGTASPADTTYPYGNTLYANVRNYMEVKLMDSLKTGIKYYVTFYANLQDGCWYSCSDMGAYFSDSIVGMDTTGAGLVKSKITPQVANDPKKQELNDTVNWMKISGSFVAKGGEKYIIIGNFKNDSMSSIRYLGQPSPDGANAWYYIDDVIVSADSNYADSLFSAVQTVSKPKSVVKVFPNPAGSSFNIEIDAPQRQKYNFCIYSVLGQKVECIEITSKTTSVVTDRLPDGIYYYRITDMTGKLIKADKVTIIH